MCIQDTLNAIIHEVLSYAENVFGNQLVKAKLYGSFARGDYDEESDVDILLLVKTDNHDLSEYEKELSDFSFELSMKYRTLVSPFLQDNEIYERYKDVYPFFMNVENEGVDLSVDAMPSLTK
ncbi:MAG: nucleotidyltransferase domain-containing protein [Clostridiales bacterium]|nr:nucleotidyltransferase domain-containing protein [Clostridiales bacterium]